MNFYPKNISIGIDLIEVKRFNNFNYNGRLAKNIFTAKELKNCRKKTDPSESLAGYFAAKEAVKKTLKENVKFNQIEITNNKKGVPQVNFLNKKIKLKYITKISIAHTQKLSQAICLTLTKK